MKTIPTFCFVDEPQYKTNDTRNHVAHLLYCYKKDPRYTMVKLQTGVYSVTLNYPNSPTAIITTR